MGPMCPSCWCFSFSINVGCCALSALSHAGQRTNTPCMKGTSFFLLRPCTPTFLPVGAGVKGRVWPTRKEIAFWECNDDSPKTQKKKRLFRVYATNLQTVDLTLPGHAFPRTRWGRLASVLIVTKGQQPPLKESSEVRTQGWHGGGGSIVSGPPAALG